MCCVRRRVGKDARADAGIGSDRGVVGGAKMRRLLVVGVLLLAGWAASSAAAPRAQGCAFSVTPNAYEPMLDRAVMLTGLELAGYNMIAPEDPFFGTPIVETGTRADRRVAFEPYVPPTLLKATGWIESSLAQADWNTPFGAVGPALISFDCGHGIMQITSGMTGPADDGWPSRQQALVATHYLYNIARGAAILVDKWNAAPQVRPVAGTDTEGSPRIIENWYFAVWSYNGFARVNHPLYPDYRDWPRTGYSCGPAPIAATTQRIQATTSGRARGIAAGRWTTATGTATVTTPTRSSSMAAPRGRPRSKRSCSGSRRTCPTPFRT
jgi:hypothetical protein